MISKTIKYIAFITALILLFPFISISVPAWAEKQLPNPVELINDFAEVISPAYKEKMNLLALEVLEKAGATVTVVTLKDIGGGNIDDFANRLYEKWGVGKKGEDRGVMLLIALKERKVRIEVGYGLEGIIPDGLAGQIRDDAIIPFLKKGEYGQGLLNGLYAVAEIIARDQGITLTGLPAAPKSVSSRRGRSFGILPFLFMVFIFWILVRSRRRGGFALFPLLFLGGGRGGFRGHSGFGGFGGGFGGFGGGMSGGGGASGSF